MRIIADSREKKNEHVLSYFGRHGIPYVVQKLDVADYMIDGQPGVVVDRKRNLSEVCTNLMTRNDSARFWREVRRAHDEGIKLYILVEHGGQIKTIRDVANWTSPYSRVTGRRLLAEMCRVEAAYGCIWVFTNKRSTGKRIVELLNGEE